MVAWRSCDGPGICKICDRCEVAVPVSHAVGLLRGESRGSQNRVHDKTPFIQSRLLNGRGKGGTATLYVNHKKVGGSGRVEHTNPNIFSADDAAAVGVDEGTNVSSAYKQHKNTFTGKIEKVRIDTK
jgi:hypothetical protein